MSIDDFRPMPFYYLNTTEPTELSLEAARRDMARLKEAGYGGCVLFNRPPTGFPIDEYLSDRWFEALEHFIVAARESGLKIWINDDWDAPPGNIGDRLLKMRPDLVQRRVELVEGEVRVIEADWKFAAYEEPEVSQLFIELVYEEYKKRFGRYFNDPIVGFFSDADSRRVLPDCPLERYYPWAKDFSGLFRTRFGYEVEPHLAGIMSDSDPAAAGDYWNLVSELYRNWFANNYKWCHANQLEYTFHTSDTGPLTSAQCRRTSVFSEGNYLELNRVSDHPGTDHELLALDGGTSTDRRYFCPEVSRGGSDARTVNPKFADTLYDTRAKYAASAAYLYGRKRPMCEPYAAVNSGATPELLRRIAAWQIMQGIGLFVPQAVHHRYWGPTKYFAPPDFTHAFTHGLRELNDFMTWGCAVAGAGTYAADTAVIDPFPEIQRGGDSGKFFEICDALNRRAVGWVIAPRGRLDEFAHVIDPWAEQPRLPEGIATFSGGEIAWMPRRTDGGEPFLLCANIWSSETLVGELEFMYRKIELELAPGEIAVIGGGHEHFRPPFHSDTAGCELAFPAPVHWLEPNEIPFHVSAGWDIEDDLGMLVLKVPVGLAGKVALNGRILEDGFPVKVFDDHYIGYTIPGAPGHRQLEFPECDYVTPLYLTGDFDVETRIENEFFRPVFHFYAMRIFEPEVFEIRLKTRRSQLEQGSWADQGAPFYYGGAVYRFDLDLPEDGTYGVELPGCAAVCEVVLDGMELGRMVWPPWRMPLGTLKGKHRLELRVFNTPANRLEEYRAPSGLISGGRIIRIQS